MRIASIEEVLEELRYLKNKKEQRLVLLKIKSDKKGIEKRLKTERKKVRKKIRTKENRVKRLIYKKKCERHTDNVKRRIRRGKKKKELGERIEKKLKLKEDRLNCGDEKEREKWKKFYGICKESQTLDQHLKELKKEGIVKETGKPKRVEFFLKGKAYIRTIHFMDELFYSKMGMLYHFNINKKDYFAVREYGLLPLWFKCNGVGQFRNRLINVWSEKQIKYLLEIMDDLKLLVGCKPHHFNEHYFDKWTDKYLEEMHKNWHKMAMEYAVKFNVARWEKKEFKILTDADIIISF